MRACNFIDMTGWVMSEHGVPDSRLTVVEYMGVKNSKTMWRCICSCQDKKEVIACATNIRNGNTLSCGCIQKERAALCGTHRESKSRLYKIWSNMKSRCLTESTTEYKNYGGRGICICDEWVNSYISFKEWALNNGYDSNLTIERIDVNGDYCPENCKWITKPQQANNTTKSRFITYNGETHTMAEWAKILGIPYSALNYRINNSKMSIEDAFTRPITSNKFLTKNENGEWI